MFHKTNIITSSLMHLRTDVTIGFVRSAYEFSEPSPGTLQQGYPVCIEVSVGSLGSDVIVQVEWLPGTAFGEWNIISSSNPLI